MRQTKQLLVMLLMIISLHTSTAMAKDRAEGLTSTYSFKDFTSLRISGVVRVYFTQGKSYSISVQESKNPNLKTIVEKQGGNLVIYTKTPQNVVNNVDYPTVRITAPHLRGIQTSGVVSVFMDNLNTNQLSVNISGASKMSFKDVKCDNLQMENSGASQLTTGLISCKTIKLKNSGASKLKMSVAGNEDADFVFSGASNCSVEYKGNQLQLMNSGAGTIQLTVDCKKLIARNSGVAKMTISGTADETEIKSSGVSKINTSKLNNF